MGTRALFAGFVRQTRDVTITVRSVILLLSPIMKNSDSYE